MCVVHERYNLDYMPFTVRAVLCDLDDTLFDHRHASIAALAEVAGEEPAFGAWTAQELHRRHAAILEELHAEVLDGRRTIDDARIERFTQLLAAAGVEGAGSRAPAVASSYRAAYERAWQPVPGAIELVSAISRLRIACVIVTNNAVAEQRRKLEGIGLARHVTALVTSEDVGVVKPAGRIFEVALEAAGVGRDEAVMFGDGWQTDIVGARDAGIAPVWFNRLGRPSPDPVVPELTSLEPTEAALERLLT